MWKSIIISGLVLGIGVSVVAVSQGYPSNNSNNRLILSKTTVLVQEKYNPRYHYPRHYRHSNYRYSSRYYNPKRYQGNRRYRSPPKRAYPRTVSRSWGFPRKRKATGRRVFIFSPKLRAWAAYDANGRLVRTGRASGGKHYCPDVGRSCRTPRGVFRIQSKRGPHCRSSRYPVGKGGAPMPYCMFFSRYYAIHGSPNVPRHNASHGCIRVLPSAARWLSQNFIRIGTTVIVRSY